MAVFDRSLLIEKFRHHENDKGSLEVQIINLSERVNYLTPHFKTNKKDYSSLRGLFKIIGQRRRFLAYLQKHDVSKHQELLAALGLRK